MSETPAVLADLLELAEWGPRQLVNAINTRLSDQGRARLRLDPTAGYSWVRRGFRPRPPIPEAAAAVLTDRLGFGVTVEQLWPGRGPALVSRSAATGVDAIAHLDDLVRELAQLTMSSATPKSQFEDASGVDLTVAVLDRLHGAVLIVKNRAGHERVLPEQVELIGAHVVALRRLDDRHGGGALSLRYVTAELRNVLDLVEYANYDLATGRRLLTIVADLAQLLGWMHFDSGRYGSAERYLLLSIGVCRALEASDRAAMPSVCSATSPLLPGTGRMPYGSRRQLPRNVARMTRSLGRACSAGKPLRRRPTVIWPGTGGVPSRPPSCSIAADRRTAHPSCTTSARCSWPRRPGKVLWCWPSRPPQIVTGYCPKELGCSPAQRRR